MYYDPIGNLLGTWAMGDELWAIALRLLLALQKLPEQIDEMLTLAHMEPLCAKNPFESVIIFILEDASLNNILDTDSEEFDPDELCRYAKEVLSGLDLPEVDTFISELNIDM